MFPSTNPKNHNLYAHTDNLGTTPCFNFPRILSGKFECVDMGTRFHGQIASLFPIVTNGF
jgi:hypothetical protein